MPEKRGLYHNMFARLRNKSKNRNIKKTIRTAFKEDVKNITKAALTQEFYNNSAETLKKNNHIESELYIQNNVKRPSKFKRYRCTGGTY